MKDMNTKKMVTQCPSTENEKKVLEKTRAGVKLSSIQGKSRVPSGLMIFATYHRHEFMGTTKNGEESSPKPSRLPS